MSMMRTPRTTRIAAAASIITALFVAYGCGSERPAVSNGDTSTSGNVFDGPCQVEGESRACHAVISEHNGLVSCFNATQTCNGGSWGACGGDANGGTITTHNFGAGGLEFASLTTGTSTGAPCSSDPCLAGCVGYNEVPPTPLVPPCGGAGFLIGNIAATNLPGPLDTNGLPKSCIADANTCISRYTVADNQTVCDDCEFDYHCVGGQCLPWLLNAAGAGAADCKSPQRVDFTVEPPCLTPTPGPATDYHITICNRGLDDAKTGTLRIGAFPAGTVPNCAGPSGPNGTSPSGGREVRFDLSGTAGAPLIPGGTIQSGSCLEVNSSNSIVTDLTGVLKPASEFISQWGGGGTGILANWDASLSECNPCNNWSGWSSAVQCTTVGTTTSTITQTYDGVCTTGYRPQWGTLAYSVNTPPGTDIKFSVNTGAAATGPWTPTTPVQVAEAAPTAPPGDHPNSCSMTGPSPCGAGYAASCACPIDLYPALSSPTPLTTANTQQEFLQLTVGFDATTFGCFTGTPTTADGTSAGCAGGQDQSQPGTSCKSTNQYTACQQDFHCDLPSSDCNWNQPHPAAGPRPAVGPNWFDPNCMSCPVSGGCASGVGLVPGVDLTVGYPCGSTVPLCNRGGGTLPAGPVDLNISNSGTSWSCGQPNPTTTAPGTLDCTWNNPAPLGPGQCAAVDSTSCPGLSFGTGQRQIYVNASLGVHECGMWANETGGGCLNNTSSIKATGKGCPASCNAPTGVVPSVNKWQVVYSCVPNE